VLSDVPWYAREFWCVSVVCRASKYGMLAVQRCMMDWSLFCGVGGGS
jgi:hypothetical protein